MINKSMDLQNLLVDWPPPLAKNENQRYLKADREMPLRQCVEH